MTQTTAYEGRKERERERQATMSRSGRDIGPISKVANMRRRNKGERDFDFFCRTYFPERFPLPFSDDHKIVIGKIENAVLHGGLFAQAMPRGNGKTTLCECAVLWAILYGHHQFVALIGAEMTSGKEMLAAIRTEIESNEMLEADFPEACEPVIALDGIVNRSGGQLSNGERTRITWSAEKLIFPTTRTDHSDSNGACVVAAGLLGRIRGMKYQRSDGKGVRPSLVIIDDPQTDESAKSPMQCEKREKVLSGAILGLAGPTVKISGIMPCTVIHDGDMADRILNRKIHPEWQGERMRMVYDMPTNLDLWDKYADILREELAADEDGSKATAFYKKNRKKMDAGAKVAWKHRFNEDEISAIQHAMNIYVLNAEAFAAEYQNDPIVARDEGEIIVAEPDEIARKVGSYKRGEVPAEASILTAYIDVQGNALFYMVMAWRKEDFRGWVIDYGTWPDQKSSYFTLSSIRKTIGRARPGVDFEGRLLWALAKCDEEIRAKNYQHVDGTRAEIVRSLTDASWGESTDTVYEFGRAVSPRWLPSFGQGIGATQKPFSERQKKPGELLGDNWSIPPAARGRPTRHALIDVNYWKSFFHRRLATPKGSKGSIELYKAKPHSHRMLADHFTAETGINVTAKGRTVVEWKLKPNRDNHWLDCAVGCTAAAAMQGCTLSSIEKPKKKKKRKKIRAKLI